MNSDRITFVGWVSEMRQLVDVKGSKKFGRKECIDFVVEGAELPPGSREFSLRKHSDTGDISRGAGTNTSVAFLDTQTGKIVGFVLRLPPHEDGQRRAENACNVANFPKDRDIGTVPLWDFVRVVVLPGEPISEDSFIDMLEDFLEDYEPESSDFDAQKKIKKGMG